MTYPTKKLGDIVDKIVGGGTPSKNNKNYWNGPIPWASVKDIKEDRLFLDKTIDSITEDGLKNSSANLIPKGSIIISTRMGLGRVVKTSIETAINQDLKAIFPGSELYSDYLIYFLLEKAEEIKSKGSGATVSGIKLDYLRSIEIPLPPLPEQKKIVEELEGKLGKVKEAIKLRQGALADTAKILPTKLTEIFEKERVEYPETILDHIADFVRGPFGGSLTKSMFVDAGYAVYEQGNVIGDQTDEFRYFVDEQKYQEMKRFAVSSGDILMSCSGTIGKFAHVRENFTEGIINQALLKITPNLSKVTREYLQFALTDYIKNSTSHVKGGAIKNIVAVKELKKIGIPLPPLKTQTKIVAELDELSKRVAQLRAHQTEQLKDLKSLEKAYLHEAFAN